MLAIVGRELGELEALVGEEDWMGAIEEKDDGVEEGEAAGVVMEGDRAGRDDGDNEKYKD